MRAVRQHRRQDLHEMENIARQLEMQYAELCDRSLAAARETEMDIHHRNEGRKQAYIEAITVAKRLGAENLLLQTKIKQNMAWKRQLQRVLDFDASNMACKP